LWRDSADLAAAALRHPFVRGLADGGLPPGRFAGFIAQDAFFLESFARAYALGLAHSPDRAGFDAFADLLAGVREELRLHASYARRLGIDLAGVEPAPATLAYTEFLLGRAAIGGLGQTCAAMTPCMRLYAHIGQSLAELPISDRYAEWVNTYADPGFEVLAVTLERLLDAYCTDVDRERVTYRRAMRLELDFFDAAHSLPATPAGTTTARSGDDEGRSVRR
jgi:thiaminase/transcriptional activator TenA